jgi:hypothetical protein
MRTSLKRSARKLLVAIAAATFLVAATTAVTTIAHASSKIYWTGTYTNGNSTWISCGSLAGNYAYECGPQGNCWDITDYRTEQFCALPD